MSFSGPAGTHPFVKKILRGITDLKIAGPCDLEPPRPPGANEKQLLIYLKPAADLFFSLHHIKVLSSRARPPKSDLESEVGALPW